MSGRKQAGMSLVEVVVAAGLMGLLGLAIGQLMTTGNKGMVDARSRAGFQDDLNVLSSGLQKYMTSNDFRFFAFTGEAAGTTNPKPMSRFLIPQPGRCRDLSTGAGCNEQSSFLYVNYDKTTTRAMMATCLLVPTAPGTPWTLIVNMADTTYGVSTFNKGARTITVTDPGGILGPQIVRIDAGAVLATFDPPKGTLFVATDKPISSRLKIDAAGDVTLKDGTPVPGDCAAQLPAAPAGKGKKKIDNLVEIEVQPFVLGQFTGASSVTDAEVQATAANMPLRVAVVDVRSIGPMPLATPAGKFDFGSTDCTVASGTNAITCSGISNVVVKPVDRVRLDEIFAISMVDAAGTPVTTTRFELLANAGMTSSASCMASPCTRLTVPANGAVPALATIDERLDNLISTSFSFIKQESLSDLKFRVITDVATEKTESFNVHFP